jgi:hypothetical protein
MIDSRLKSAAWESTRETLAVARNLERIWLDVLEEAPPLQLRHLIEALQANASSLGHRQDL